MEGITIMRAPTIGWLARAAGVNVETVRYYERIGLVPKAPRSPSGRRNYGLGHARRLLFIRRAKARAIAAVRLESLRAKRAELCRQEVALTAAISKCGEATAPCPLLDMLGRIN